MRLIQSIDNIGWTIHEKDGSFNLTIWHGDGCDRVLAVKCSGLDVAKAELLKWVRGVLDGTITLSYIDEEI